MCCVDCGAVERNLAELMIEQRVATAQRVIKNRALLCINIRIYDMEIDGASDHFNRVFKFVEVVRPLLWFVFAWCAMSGSVIALSLIAIVDRNTFLFIGSGLSVLGTALVLGSGCMAKSDHRQVCFATIVIIYHLS